jgi:hypothetical protein
LLIIKDFGAHRAPLQRTKPGSSPLGEGGVLCGHNHGAVAKRCEIRRQSHAAKFLTDGFKQ